MSLKHHVKSHHIVSKLEWSIDKQGICNKFNKITDENKTLWKKNYTTIYSLKISKIESYIFVQFIKIYVNLSSVELYVQAY